MNPLSGSPRLRQTPIVVGHRGARGVLPENTLAGLQYLDSIGVDAVEIDVQNAAGQIPVVIHDPRIPVAIAKLPTGDRLAAPGPRIVETRVDELQRYDIGQLDMASSYGQNYPDQVPVPGQRVPTFEAICAYAADHPSLTLYVEIKSFADRADLGDPPEILADRVLDIADAYDLRPRLVISSFDWRVLRAVSLRAPSIKRGYLSYIQRPNPTMQPNIIDQSAWIDHLRLEDYGHSLPKMVKALGGASWNPYFEDLTEELIAEAHHLDLDVFVWTVNDPSDIKNMIDLQVDGLITDYPERALQALQQTVIADASL